MCSPAWRSSSEGMPAGRRRAGRRIRTAPHTDVHRQTQMAAGCTAWAGRRSASDGTHRVPDGVARHSRRSSQSLSDERGEHSELHNKRQDDVEHEKDLGSLARWCHVPIANCRECDDGEVQSSVHAVLAGWKQETPEKCSCKACCHDVCCNALCSPERAHNGCDG